MCMYVCMYIYIYIERERERERETATRPPKREQRRVCIRSISEISSCFFGPRPWHIEIRHCVKKNIHN